MKKLINSCIASFAMFSRIPMPRCDWEKENIRFMLLFMPLVGVVIGAVSFAWYMITDVFWLGGELNTIILMLIPFVLTGGIHLDGFLDTSDALSSWKPTHERVQILKDVHVGAFAVIRGVVYFVFLFGVYSALDDAGELIPFLWLVFVMSRCFNAYSILTFKKAKETGTVNTWEANAHPVCKKGLLVIFALAAVIGLVLQPLYGIVMTVSMIVVFIWYRQKSMKYFGGMTGDLAGYFVCISEPCAMFVLLVVRAVLNYIA